MSADQMKINLVHRLNLGCGQRKLEGYTNIDVVAGADVVGNALDLSRFETESVDEIRADSFFEHIFIEDVPTFLEECRRVLKPDGFIQFNWIPDFNRVAEAFQNKLPSTVGRPEFDIADVNKFLYGGEVTKESATWQLHKAIYTVESLEYVLTRAGFVDVKVENTIYPGESAAYTLSAFARRGDVSTKPKVLIVSPIYKPPAHPKFIESLKSCMNDPRMDVSFESIGGDAHIERARAMLLEKYLRYNKKWDWLVMIDSDIEFNADILYGLITRGKDCIGAAYAFKSPEGTPKYQMPVIRPMANEEPDDTGLVRVRYLGGGFTICSDALIQRMCKEYEDLRFYINPDLNPDKSDGRTYAFWTPILIEQPGWGDGKKEMLSEDYAFCQRILDMGEDCWLDLRAVLSHWDGEKSYQLKTSSVSSTA